MEKRALAGTTVRPVGLGCMNLSHGYSNFPTAKEGTRLLQHALDAGVDHFDTATLYGGGRNEELLGSALLGRRDEYFLASKGGLAVVDGRGATDGRPATIKAQAEASLRKLNTDRIDLYYLHRLDRSVPVEDSVGALADWWRRGRSAASACPRSPPRRCAGPMLSIRSRPCRTNTRCGPATRRWPCSRPAASWAPPWWRSARWPAAS